MQHFFAALICWMPFTGHLDMCDQCDADQVAKAKIEGIASSSTESQAFISLAYGSSTTFTNNQTQKVTAFTGTPSIINSGGFFAFQIASASGSPSNSGIVFHLYQ